MQRRLALLEAVAKGERADIALDNPDAATVLVTQVLQAVERLERFPMLHSVPA